MRLGFWFFRPDPGLLGLFGIGPRQKKKKTPTQSRFRTNQKKKKPKTIPNLTHSDTHSFTSLIAPHRDSPSDTLTSLAHSTVTAGRPSSLSSPAPLPRPRTVSVCSHLLPPLLCLRRLCRPGRLGSAVPRLSLPPPRPSSLFSICQDKQRVIGGAVTTKKMKGLGPHAPMVSRGKPPPLLAVVDTLPCCPSLPTITTLSQSRCRQKSTLSLARGTIRAQTSNTGIGPRDFGSRSDIDGQNVPQGSPLNKSSRKIVKPPKWIARYPTFIALALIGCALVFSLVTFLKGGPASVLAAISKSGFTAAFTLIFVSEIGDKTFFIAALLAMQYEKGLVLLGSMGALALMTILSVVIGRIFQSVPAQFQTTLPIGEYAAVTLLLFFGLKAIKDAWDLPSNGVKNGGNGNSELNEFAEAEELVKEKVSKRLSNPFEVIWKSFSLVFFAEWGDRSMLATIALGAAQSPWGVASGAIGGHLLATSIAIVGGALLANYISEKLVGYLGGGLFLIFAVATFFGVF